MSLKTKIFCFIKKTIESNGKRDFLSRCVLFILYLMSKIFQFAVFFKNYFYDLKILEIFKPEIYVISIGNIIAGGGGKTPFLIYLSKILEKKFLGKIAVISRGYLSESEKKNIFVEDDKYLAKDIGDEPLLINKKLIDCLLFVGRDRKISAKMAFDKKAKIAILDDGFQYRSLFRDLDIVLLNSFDLFGKNHFLPRGFLRDSKKSLKRADLIVVSNCFSKISNIEKILKDYLVIYTKPKIIAFKNAENHKFTLQPGEKVAIFCGLAYPTQFEKILENFNIVLTYFLQDHEKFSNSDLRRFAEKAKNLDAKYILCTEKDFVKLDLSLKFSIPIVYVEIEIEIVKGKEIFEKLIEKIVKKVNNKFV